MADDEITRLQLDQDRIEYQRRLEAEQEQREPDSTKQPRMMGWGILLFSLFLILIQTGIEWATAGTVGWFIGAPISLILWFILKPYRESMKDARRFLDLTLFWTAIPLVDVLPMDLIGVIFAFIVSRRKQDIGKYNPE